MTVRPQEGLDAFTAACDTGSCLTILTDRRGRVLHFGAEAERVSGYRAEEVVGREVWTVLVAEDQREAVAALFRRRQPRVAPAVVDWVTRDGRRRSIAWASRELRDGPEPARMLLTGTDLTEERLAHGLLASVLDADAGLAILATDAAGTLTFVNPGAERLLARSADEVVGLPLTCLHDPDDLAARAQELGDPRLGEAVLGAVRHGLSREHRDWLLVRGDGTTLTASVTVSGMRDGVGRVTGFLLVAQNVTSERRSQQHLESALATERRAVDRLRALDDARTDFITTVSHELRTPLTTIQGYTDVLLEGDVGELTDDQHRVVERIRRSGQRLRRQVEDLLLLTEVDSGTLLSTRAPVELADVLGTALRELDPETRARIDVDLEAGSTTVLGDSAQLVGVVRGIVDNALKFSLHRDRVQVRLRRDGTAQVIEVADTGVGIPRAEQQHLFERFFRCATAQAIAAQGLGLGLTVAAAVVAVHDGDVSISSVEGAGTTVVVRLPSYDPQTDSEAPLVSAAGRA